MTPKRKPTFTGEFKKEAEELWWAFRHMIPCPKCTEMTRFTKTHCGSCKQDMGINKFTWERVLKRDMYGFEEVK